MLSCKKCLNNNFEWSKNIDGNSIATCQQCGQEAVFQKHKRVEKEGDLCRHCNHPVVLKESKFKKNKLKKLYYYNAYYWCPQCKTMYLSEKFKVYNKAQSI